MTNKEILQSHNSTISNNNLSIDELIEDINNLPDAGSGEVEITLQEKTISPSTSNQEVIADSSYDGLSKVTIKAVDSSIDSDIKASNIRTGVNILGVNGTMEEYVEPSLQAKTVSPTTSSQIVTADTGYDGLREVTVNAMPTTTQATPSIDVSSSGLITASSTQSSGYVSSGTKSATKQLTTKGATTWTPKTTNQTISSGTYLTGTQTITGDSNLVASNIKNGVSIFGVAGTLEEKEELSTELTEQSSLLTSQSMTIDDIKLALQGKGTGGGITPEGIINITSNGTHDVTNYASAEVNVPSVQDTTIEDGFVTRTLTSYTNNRVTKVGNQAFRGFSSLESISLPNVTTINAYALDGCSGLTNVNLPKVTALNNYAMQGCSSLETLEFQQKMSTQGAVWNNCSKLTKLILRSTTMCGLSNKNCFNNTPIASGTGFIYVPDNLVDTYKANTNWSNFAAQIKGLSELEE